jgi:hypothetical protein
MYSTLRPDTLLDLGVTALPPRTLVDSAAAVHHSCSSISTIPLDEHPSSMASVPFLRPERARDDDPAACLPPSRREINIGDLKRALKDNCGWTARDFAGSPVVGEGSMELDALRARRQASKENALPPHEVRTNGAEGPDGFRARAGGYEARLEGLEVAAEQSSARAAAAKLCQDPEIYYHGTGTDAAPRDRRGTGAMGGGDVKPSSWWQSQVQEVHDRACGCGDFRSHFRRSCVPRLSGMKKAGAQ